jgi:hypothetical protein
MSNQSEAAPSSSASSAIVSKSNMTLALVPVQKQLQTYIVVKCMSWLYQMEHMKLAQVNVLSSFKNVILSIDFLI